jgi:pyruvate dehydrogenase E1 component alpha subunit
MVGFSDPQKDDANPEKFYEVVHEAVKRARAGEGPTLIECKTYRQRGHFEGDPMIYRSREEMEEWRKKDPLHRFQARLGEMKVLAAADIEAMEQEIRNQIEEAIQYAEESPPPDPAEMLEDVYA